MSPKENDSEIGYEEAVNELEEILEELDDEQIDVDQDRKSVV